MIIKTAVNRGVVHSIAIGCSRCGGKAMYQEWIEPASNKRDFSYKRYGVIFCQECDNKTKIHSERTPEETKNECIHERKLRNEFIKKNQHKALKNEQTEEKCS